MTPGDDITMLERQQDEIRAELAPLADQFIAAAGLFAAAHHREAVERAVTDQPELAKARGSKSSSH